MMIWKLSFLEKINRKKDKNVSLYGGRAEI